MNEEGLDFMWSFQQRDSICRGRFLFANNSEVHGLLQNTKFGLLQKLEKGSYEY